MIKSDKIKSIFSYSLIKYIALIIGFLKGLINASALGPELLGVLGNLLLVFSYLNYCNLGILNSMNREYVIYKDYDEKKAKDVLDTTITFLLIISIIFFTLGVIFFYIYYKYNFTMAVSYLLLFLSAIFEQYKAYFINYFRLVDKVRKINIIELISNGISLLLVVLLIFKYNIIAVMISMFISGLFCMIYGFINHESIRISINGRILSDLLKIGIPLLIYNLGYYILSTIDRLMIIKYLSKTDLGYYTFANQIVQATLVFVSSFIFLYYPRVIKLFNTNVEGSLNKEEIFSLIKKFTKVIELISVLLITVGLIGINPFVNILLPQYKPAISIYGVLSIGLLIAKFSNLANIYIVSNKKQTYLLLLQGISIVLAISLNYLFLWFGLGLLGVAFATMLVNVVYSICEFTVYFKISGIKNYIGNNLNLYKKLLPFSIILVLLNSIKLNVFVYSTLVILVTIIFYYKDAKEIVKNRDKI